MGITALVAALLFIAYDISRSFDEARLLAATLQRDIDGEALWQGIAQRAALVLMLALAAAGFAYRRHRSGRLRFGPSATLDTAELLDRIPCGVAVWTDAGELVLCNERYAARARGEAQAPLRRYEEALQQLTRCGRMTLVAEDDTQRLLEFEGVDGSCLAIDERPLAGGGFVTLVSDITDRRQTGLLLTAAQQEHRLLARRYHEEKLKAEAASRAKTSFLAHLSHDIRTPLNHIIGFADMIRHQTYGPLGDARYLNYIELIKASGDRLLGSFATILELVELESGERPLRQEPVEIDALLASTARRFSAQAQRAGLMLRTGAPTRAALAGDRFALERMVGNIVENAIRFTPAGGRISLMAYVAEDGVVLEITDTGIGMSEAQLERTAQPFAFGDAAFSREHQGAGLGIAIARAIAELSGGHLAIDSSPALGTTVAISLPLGMAQPARGAVAA